MSQFSDDKSSLVHCLPERQWRNTRLLMSSGVKLLKETLYNHRNELIWLTLSKRDWQQNVPEIFHPPQTEARKHTRNMALDSENSLTHWKLFKLPPFHWGVYKSTDPSIRGWQGSVCLGEPTLEKPLLAPTICLQLGFHGWCLQVASEMLTLLHKLHPVTNQNGKK